MCLLVAALAFGGALSQALGDRKGIHRFGDFSAPLDEALVHVVLVGAIYAAAQTDGTQTLLQIRAESLTVSCCTAPAAVFMHTSGLSLYAEASGHCAYLRMQSRCSLSRCGLVQDLSGRPHLSYDLQIPTQHIGTYDTQLVEHFFQSVVNTSGMTLHIRQLAGQNSHHIVEATFKAFARALRKACEVDERRAGQIASSKGVLTQQ